MRSVSNAVLLVEKAKVNNTETPHEHSYVDGVCSCGQVDPNYNGGSAGDNHSHYYSNATCTEPATCECGATIGNALGHKFYNGVCTRCQAEDPDYVPPHVHEYVEGKCECGAEDPDYVAHEHEFVEGKCECGEEDPNYTAPTEPVAKPNSFAALIQAIIDAIMKFFKELFS